MTRQAGSSASGPERTANATTDHITVQWHRFDPQAVLAELAVTDTGLTDAEATRRLAQPVPTSRASAARKARGVFYGSSSPRQWCLC